jgi:hypothetical protein
MGLKELREGFGIGSREPRSRKIKTFLLCMAPFLCGLPLALVFLDCYPFLTRDRTFYLVAGSSLCFFFLLSFAALRYDPDLSKFSLFFRIAARFGWALASTAFLWGLIGVVNGLGTPQESRVVPVVARHPTLERDPARRTYYIAVRPWLGSHTVVELPAPRSTYDRLLMPVDAIDTPQTVLDEMPDTGQAIFIVGRGRLGLEWLKSIEPLANSVDPRS